jgi:hypothetical protein
MSEKSKAGETRKIPGSLEEELEMLRKDAAKPMKDKIGYGKPPRGLPFSKTYQPQNPGRKGKSTTEFLKEIGVSKKIKYHMTITDSKDVTRVRKGEIKSRVSINQLLATLLVDEAINGNDKAMKEILDRTEGKAQQFLDVTSKGEQLGTLSREEKLERIQELLEKLNASKK